MLILLSLIVILCSLTAVNASDINDITSDNSLTELNNENTNQAVLTYSASTDSNSENDAVKTINKKDNSKSLKADSEKGTFNELQGLIDNAYNSSTIYLDKDYKNDESIFNKFNAVIINKTITIDGQGHTLDANTKNRVFEISADNVVLRNLTFINGKKSSVSYGDTIYWGGKNGLIENCILKESQLYLDDSKVYGGGIYADGEHLTIRNCEFNTLKGQYGSAIYLNSKNNVIDNCSFTYNYYYSDAYVIPGESNVDDVNVPAKYTNTIGGGAIYVDSTGNTIKDSYFAYNIAQEGGAIYINRQKNTVDSCIFYNNRASKYGAAIYVDAKNNKINNNMFYLNNLNDKPYDMGTFSDIYSSVSMSADKNWWGNVNKDICNPKTYNMNDKNVKPTTNNDKVTVNNWYYIDVVDKSGNSIPKIITRIGDFVGNTFDLKFMFKLSSGNGDFNYPDYTNEFNLTGDKLSLFDGSIYTNKITREFTGDSLTFNMLTNEPKSTLTMKNSIFGIDVQFTFKETYPLSRLQNIIDNVWENDTAYIYDNYKYDPSVDADMINGIIINKTITIDGKGATIDLDYKTRGFYVNAPEVTIKNINIINGNLGNGGMGGAIYFSSKFGEIINTTFEGNTADYGGAVAVTQDYVTVTNSTFKNNYASEKGAGIYVVAKGLRITNNLFDSNHAAGGENPCVEGYTWAIYFSDNNTYINNSITGIGGKDDDDISPSNKPKGQFSIVNRKSFTKQIFHDKITVNGKEIPITNNQLTLDVLNQIFNQNFTNGHLLVYIDGKLVFNDTTTDDLSQLIYNLINLLSGKHEIKVEFTDKDGNTNSYTENITV